MCVLLVYYFKYDSYWGTEYGRKYREVKFLGRGAFGEVYLAFSKETCKHFAVKKIQKNLIHNGTIQTRDDKIENEVKILQRLKHVMSTHISNNCYFIFVFI